MIISKPNSQEKQQYELDVLKIADDNLSLPFLFWRTKSGYIVQNLQHKKNPKSALCEIGFTHLNRDARKNKMLLHLN